MVYIPRCTKDPLQYEYYTSLYEQSRVHKGERAVLLPLKEQIYS